MRRFRNYKCCYVTDRWPIPVAVLSKGQICGSVIAGLRVRIVQAHGRWSVGTGLSDWLVIRSEETYRRSV